MGAADALVSRQSAIARYRPLNASGAYSTRLRSFGDLRAHRTAHLRIDMCEWLATAATHTMTDSVELRSWVDLRSSRVWKTCPTDDIFQLPGDGAVVGNQYAVGRSGVHGCTPAFGRRGVFAPCERV